MKYSVTLLGIACLILPAIVVSGEAVKNQAPISDATSDCLECHKTATPGIVADWKRSRHFRTSPALALKKPEIQRRISATKIPDELMNTAIGCAECHTLNPGVHKDTFDHEGKKVYPVVSPRDCATCHPVEEKQFAQNLMSHAWGNLINNKLYQTLMTAVNGVHSYGSMPIILSEPDSSRNTKKTPSEQHSARNQWKVLSEPDSMRNADSCLSCHGTQVKVTGKKTKDTDYGEMEFPVLSGWPNQGVGRINPDGTRGSCTACHTRHEFSIEMARKPQTCSQCHKGPDVPAYKVYMVSKHGNLFSAMRNNWSFKEVPWTLGKDFPAPTCAACHVSLLVNQDGDVIAKRTHQMADRIPMRILGLPYAHAHPKSPDTSIIRNKDGLPIPTTLTGVPAAGFLIDSKEQTKRRKAMQTVCLSCHGSSWVNGQWARLENTIAETNEKTFKATEILRHAWKEKVADPSNIFDEVIEKQWVEFWLFYANSIRYASAMMGTDYGVFANGRWQASKRIQELLERLPGKENPFKFLIEKRTEKP